MYDLTGAVWHKSSRSNNSNNCVEVATGVPGCDVVVAVRDSKERSGPVLVFRRGEWKAFLAGAHAGDFDLNQ
ncbi:DUF397 domain-containing protein [Micromonospora sp. NBC_01813]|uniref:DUF397 domain-containing protein n=1 Tax=Micromonospora sp. NBC_01813 TaxID=2975988 RepID=UPI002DDA6941|nr:DUF397 domain-containing protein [Micromonospora sp. NBC_01813]WSA09831.1 DUF397 domain-containing protein [Micromonospora sp. NBC_01813]